MRKLSQIAVALVLGAASLNADSSLAPALQWVKTMGGSGANQVTAAAADTRGNLYIAGNTTSVDFPVTPAAAQRKFGGASDAFVVKLDSNGGVVYSTYFGGSGADSAVALAVASDGSVYVAGTTASRDFPTTPGAYAAAGSNFVFKLNPDGSLAWSTFFADSSSVVGAIAIDAAGSAYIAGVSNGSLPTTPGAYATQYQVTVACYPPMGGCIASPSSGFVTKFSAGGTSLIYSTYVPAYFYQFSVGPGVGSPSPSSQAVVVGTNGNAYFGGGEYPMGGGYLVLLNAAGSAVLASTSQSNVSISALALGADGNLYATGSTALRYPNTPPFPATAGAFQTAPQPAIPSLPGELGAGGQTDAFVMKWDAGLSHLLAATLLGGESYDVGENIAVDSSGNVIVSGVTDSKAFPTSAPFQTSFSRNAGFVAGLDSSLSQLLFSTYLGDERPIDARAVPDGSGNILLAGSVLAVGSSFSGGVPSFSDTVGALVVANKIALAPAPAVRLDSVVNFASGMAPPLTPGEAIAAIGSGFGAGAQLLIDGAPVPVVSATATSLVAVVPDSAKTSGALQVQVSASGALSNTVLVPAALASPGIYSVDGSGYGQGYILNSDGTLNSPANPAAPGSTITIFATGAGPLSLVGPYAVPALPPAVYIDGVYADGIDAIAAPVAGMPGNVYQIGVYVPQLANFKMPPQVGVRLIFGTVNGYNSDLSAIISQAGLVLNVKE